MPVFRRDDWPRGVAAARSRGMENAILDRVSVLTKGVRPEPGEIDALEAATAELTNAASAAKVRTAMYNSGGALDGDSLLAARGIGGGGVPVGSATSMSREVLRDCYEAARSRRPWRTEVKAKAAGSVVTKAAGAPVSGIGLPAHVDPSLTQALSLEPDRLFGHFPGVSTDAPVVEYYAHTGNVNSASVVAELGTKPDLGIQLTTRTATMTKIAALASASMEALSDFDTFVNFIPAELQRAVIDAETAWVAAQLMGTSGVLTRAKGTSEAPLDTMLGAFNDLRTGPAYTEPNLVALHPSTWTWLRTQKDSYGRYLLNPDPTSDQRPNIWGVPVITNTKLTVGDAIVLDTNAVRAWTRMGLTIESNSLGDSEWTTNAVSFRSEERIGVGVLRPAGVNVVTGLSAS